MQSLSKASIAAAAVLLAMTIIVPPALADSVSFAVSPSKESSVPVERSYSKAWSQVAKAAASRKTSIVFAGEGVEYDTWCDVVDDMRVSKGYGLYGKRHSDTMVAVDRLGINMEKGVHTNLALVDDNLAATSVRLHYYPAKLVKKAQQAEYRVAKHAKTIKSKKKRLTYLHDWVVKNTAYKNVASTKWSKASKYGVKNSMIDKTSIGPLVGHRGNCHTYTLTFMRLAKASGFKDVRYVSCLTPNGAKHAMAAVKVSGKWLYVDCTWDEVYGHTSKGIKTEKYSKVSHKYLLKSKQYMLNHGYRF